ncbi:universal stress protein [Streptomyces sp. RY43-2]|uniref:Universal stress protein n=1 Tax=Streptomyces macrolidinus TaxID=2952607 RepID=A0ABT0ZF62_9ACTN|nr:universal stress protein [Streptomyces macrolidinus]MCN9242216.1 universal stress protein [Streptomyces macrolidinus]
MEAKLSPVVAGVDGSAESLSAAEWAAREALRRGRPLLLVHAFRRHPRQQADASENGAPPRDVLRAAAEHLRRACPGVRVADEPVEGPAPEALLRAAEDAELLVVGSRGLSGIKGLLVGSVALAVVADATRPVVLVRAGEQTEDEPADGTGPPTGCPDVVLGIDVADPCDEVIEFAFEAARLRKARLRVLYAWHAPSPFGLGNGDIGLVSGAERAAEWLRFLSAVLHPWREKYPRVEVLESVLADKPSTGLVRAASSASLLVVGRRRRLTARADGSHTGPITHAVIRRAGCPVAVVPHA